MKNLFVASFICLLISCSQTKELELPIANSLDYEKYLQKADGEEVKNLEEEVVFWKTKLAEQPRGFTYMQKLGSAHLQLFEKTGKVDHLSKSKEFFHQSEKLVNGKSKAGNLLTLSSLAIKQHKFKEANGYALTAVEHTSEKFGALLMQYDSEMELGNYEMAESILIRNKRMDSFDYLVRLSKFKDHEGNLDSAIVYMEQAYQLVKHEESSRSIWAEANLGDMYGHAGRIEESYLKYLSVLDQDPDYHYALKGIAWIAYSADKNFSEAERIMNFIATETEMPDAKLQLAELARSKGNEKEAAALIEQFLAEASQKKYKGMYNKYLISIYSEELVDFDRALKLAQSEVQARPTPATYDWLAWTYFLKGENDKALDIYERNVMDKTEEPDVLFHMGTVYHRASRKEGKGLLKDALDASFELGPEVTKSIISELKS